MGLEFLARVRKSSLWVGGVVALMTGTYATPAAGLAVAVGAAWSLINLALIQRLIVAITRSDRKQWPVLKQAALAVNGMLVLFAIGAFLLAKLPPQSLLCGFLLSFAVIVLKAASLMLLETGMWRRFVRDPRRVNGLWLALLLVAAAAPALVVAAHGESQGPQKFANVITVLARAFPNEPWAQLLHEFEAVFFALGVAFLLGLLAHFASRNPTMIPGPLQNAAEMVVEKLYDFVVGILGPRHGPRYVPFLGTLFIYILVMNLLGLIPFMDSPTSSLNVTVALALTVFVYAQFIGFRELGPVGYLDHMAGSPRTAIGWFLVPLMLPIHLMGELAKPISLSCRLFGNVFGEDMLLVAFVTLGIMVTSFSHLPIGLPLQLPFMILALLTGTLQALVFTVLSTIYFLLMLPHESHDHEAEAHHAH